MSILLKITVDVPMVPIDVRRRLAAAVEAVDPTGIPTLTPYVGRTDDNGLMP